VSVGRVEFGVLGPVVLWHEGRELTITSSHQRCVLALLLLEAGRMVPLDRMVDVLWDTDSAPRTARNVVQQCVSELRRLLATDPEVRLVHRAPGYVLEVDPLRVDLHRFRSLATDARTVDRAAGLRRALGLWRGEPLAAADAPGLVPVRQALAEERVAALEECLAAEVESGRHVPAVSELTALVAEHPLRERPAELLMLALYRGGRTAEALTHYQRTRQRLAEDLGADPGQALQQLHQRILTADPTLTTTASPHPRGTGHATVAPRQLPAPPAPFIGRRSELDRLDTALNAAVHMPTVVISALSGAGGIGKTWLALHWAHRNADRFPDGQLFVDLRGFSPDSEPLDPAAAVRGFLDALGADPSRLPTDLDAQAALYRSLVADKRMLIVLDNAVGTEQVTPLLPGTSTCTVMVTGRRRFASLIDRHGARHLQLDVLSRIEAHALLIERLGKERVAAEPDAVDELIELCGHYPLALAIMARHAAFQPQVLLAELAPELRELGLDMLDDDDPTASLPAVLSWSLRTLTDEQRTLFGLLSIAPGPDTTLPAAVSLTGLPPARARRALLALEKASLVERRQGGRYAMHDLVREYAGTTLPDGAREPALARVMNFHLHTAFAADRLLNPHRDFLHPGPLAPGVLPHPLSDAAAATAWLDAEHTTLLATQRAAIALGYHHVVWNLAWALENFHLRRGHLRDALATWRAALEASAHLPDPTARLRAHRLLGRACSRLGLHEEAIEHLNQAIVQAVHHHDPTEQAHTHRTLALAWGRQGDDRRALDHARQALDLHRALDQPKWEAHALNQMGWYAARMGDFDIARDHCHAALILHRHHHNPIPEAAALDSLGFIAHHTGDHRLAVDHYHQALDLLRALDNTYEVAETLDSVGFPHVALGHHRQARQVWWEALELYREQGRDIDADRVQRQLHDLDKVTEIDRNGA